MDDNAASDDQSAPDAAPTEPLTVETLAAKMGWRPKEEYKGDPEKWRDAGEFVLAEREVTSTLKDTVRGLKDTVDRMAKTADKQTERALREQAERIQAEWEQAVEDGDKAAAAKAEKNMRELEKSAAPTLDPEAEFKRDNPWYLVDEDATAYAASISQRELNKGIPFDRHKATVEAAVRKRFPELFEKPVKQPPPVNAPNSRSSFARKGTGFSDLPPEAKMAGERFAALFADKFGITTDQAKANYAKDYFDNAA